MLRKSGSFGYPMNPAPSYYDSHQFFFLQPARHRFSLKETKPSSGEAAMGMLERSLSVNTFHRIPQLIKAHDRNPWGLQGGDE
jgi:hypothetical protein